MSVQTHIPYSNRHIQPQRYRTKNGKTGTVIVDSYTFPASAFASAHQEAAACHTLHTYKSMVEIRLKLYACKAQPRAWVLKRQTDSFLAGATQSLYRVAPSIWTPSATLCWWTTQDAIGFRSHQPISISKSRQIAALR